MGIECIVFNNATVGDGDTLWLQNTHLGCNKRCVQYPAQRKPDRTLHPCAPVSVVVEAGGSEVKGHPPPHTTLDHG